MDSKPLLLPTKTNANIATEKRITSTGKLANFGVRICANSVVKGGK